MEPDIRVGEAAVPGHAEGGWALPGGSRTLSPVVAQRVARELDAEIRARAAVWRAMGRYYRSVRT